MTDFISIKEEHAVENKEYVYRDNHNDWSNESELTEKDLKIMADHLEAYVDMYKHIFIIPDNIKLSEEDVNEAIAVVKSLIKKLRKGDWSVIKDCDELNIV